MAGESSADRWRLVRGTNLRPEDRHCLLTLFLFQGNNDIAFCKQETIADEIGVSTRSIRKSLKRLNAAGIVESEWRVLNSIPMRTYAIKFDVLKTVQRGNGRNHSSDPERIDGRNHSSAPVGTTVPDHQEPQFLQEDPLNIQGRSTLGNSTNSRVRSAGKSNAKTAEELTAFCIEWNNWHSAGIVRAKIKNTNRPGKTIVDAWNRSQRDPDQRARLQDLPKLRSAIEGSQQLLKPAGWFDAAGLLGGKNSNRRWYCEQLLAGTYRDKPANGAAASPEAEQAEQAFQSLLDSLQRHSRFKPEQIMAEVGDRTWQALRPIGLKKLDEANEFDRREMQKRFIQEFLKQGAAA